MATPQLELKREAAKYINLEAYKKENPRSNLDFRTKLNKYQVKKLQNAINLIKNKFGEYHNQIVPMGTGRARYMEKAGLPSYTAGIPLPGGIKQNKDLKYTGGELQYKRGKHNAQRSIIEIDTANGEQGVIDSLDAIWKTRKGRKATATANNRAIGSVVPTKEKRVFVREVLYVFNKYEQAFQNNGLVDENTENVPEGLFVQGTTVYRYIGGNKNKPVPVAHPSDWGMGVMFEGSIKK
jgi:hypothetical protein